MTVIRWMILALVALMVLVGCSPNSSTASQGYADLLKGAVFDPPRSLKDFTLAATSGDTFSLSAQQGRIVLLYFGYLTCPDVCPTTMAQLQAVYSHLEQSASKVKVVLVSVDPERDTLENLARYTQAFNADFIGLRGEGDALKQVMNQFGVTAVKQSVGDSPLSYLIDHTASVFLIAPDGRLAAQYLYGTDYHDILNDVQVILQAQTT